MANVMHSLETGQYVPDTGWYEMGLQAKLSIGQPVEKNQEGANHGGHLVVQPKRMMVQGRAQPLTGDSVTYGDSMRASRRVKENKTGLPDRLKAGIENLSGYSMDDVRVHYNSQKPAQLQALAYAQGTEIHVGPGQEKHLAHEAWHVVQQKQARVKRKVQKNGVQLNDDVELEREAEEMGKKAWMKRRDENACRITQVPMTRTEDHDMTEVVQRKPGLVARMFRGGAAMRAYTGWKVEPRPVESRKSGGRQEAYELLSKYLPRTHVGGVMAMPVQEFYSMSGETVSGEIGNHYKQLEAEGLLSLPPTDDNLNKVAQRETEWWKQQSGFPGFAGGSVSAQTRFDILKAYRDQ
ncbi:MAG: DUF4157 domain-containing protein [Moorea sp. SIO3I7]|nr:DUF4157 domain-containing protein [Moorena sp. SIO3I7]NEO09004.1 DUF4157 domain-containing protein [Moorena sp. SIO3I8]NEO22457.1 DUF4157 domain-containing protein [Moorena sp. SIO4A5]NEP23902.1 DUF4157 domain-containing protein [Moorena sp. SIO3I6]NEQ56557.1 DUF4157 domain-containing protein [Moorena sp. SIO4A1]